MWLDVLPVELWLGFIATILTLILVDLCIALRSKRTMNLCTALITGTIWVGLAIAFYAFILICIDKQKAILFATGYLIELLLSIDNVFVFILIFDYLGIRTQHQHMVLFIGVSSAIILRFIMIVSGVYLVNQFQWLFYVLGAFLIYSAFRIVMRSNKLEKQKESPLIQFLKQKFRITDTLHGNKLWVKQNNKFYFTPLFLALILIEQADIVFALDSVPAILAITNDLFIVFTSNIFAILGLRSMYFILANIIHHFFYIKHALALILGYIGFKMIASLHGLHIPIMLSLLVMISSMLIAIIASLIRKRYLKQQISPIN